MAENSIKKIAVLGAESSGKTWLCENLALHYNTVWVPEYAREYFNDSDIYNYTLDDLVAIAQKQIELEDKLYKQAHRFLFCDTSLITLKIWAGLEFNTTPLFIEEQLVKTQYDHYFITDNQLPWVADDLRQNKHSRELLFKMNEAEVKKTNTHYTIVTGKNEERLNNVIKKIELIYGN